MNFNVSVSTEKALLIFGEQAIGKSTAARSIAQNFGEFEIVCGADYLSPESLLLFTPQSETVNAIIFEECPQGFDFEKAFKTISNGLTISLKFIFITQKMPNLSDNANFELLDLVAIRQPQLV